MMATRPPVQEEDTRQAAPVETIDAGRRRRFTFGTRSTPRPPLSQIARELNWRLLLLIGIGGGALWTIFLSQQNNLTFFAGLLPVGGGIWVGRQVKQHVGWHAAALSMITVIA